MKILIIKLGALGDIIVSTSVIKQILDHHKQDQTFLLTKPGFKDLFVSFENLGVMDFERGGFIEAVKTIRWIRKNHFDRIYDLQSNDRTSIYCALSGAPYRAGNHPRFPYTIHPKEEYIGQCHSFERLNQIIQAAGLSPAQERPYLPVQEETVANVSQWLAEKDLIERPFALFHAGSSPLHLKKRWPHFLSLAKELNTIIQIVWVGGQDDEELNKALSEKIGINATNRFDILSLVELGKRARFAVTNDSAPMHILSCSGIPVFGLFGPTYPRRTHPLGQLENVITPSGQIAKNDDDFIPEDIANISLQSVMEKLQARKLI